MKGEKGEETGGLSNHVGIIVGLGTLPFNEFSLELISDSNRKYHVEILAPPLEMAGPTNGFPVLFLTDADVCFGTARDFVRAAMWAGEIPPVVLVGIGYRAQTLAKFSERREWDFTVETVDEERTDFDRALPSPQGGAEEFSEFLRTKVRDEVARRVSVDPKRQALIGYSLGGAFVSHALFSKPDDYQSYAIGSPALYRNNGKILREGLNFIPPKSMSGRIYISACEHEDFNPQGELKEFIRHYIDLARHLRANVGSNVQIRTEILPSETHFTGMIPFIRRALGYLAEAWVERTAT